jgi:L-ribulose-5-phosphate 3-epimerase
VDRRQLLMTAAAGAVGIAAGRWPGLVNSAEEPAAVRRANPIAVSTYSFWQFRHEELRDIEKCIDLAAEWGFDGVEILHRQMTSEEPGYLQRLKRRAFVHGMSLCGFSTHQGFLSPDVEQRKKNIDHTIHGIELAYAMGIPTT